MLHYVTDQPEKVAAAVAAVIPHMNGRPFGNCSALGVVDDAGQLLGGVVFHSWNPEFRWVEVSMGARERAYWCTPETVQRVYSYVFDELKCQMTFSYTFADADVNQKMLASIGYTFTPIPRLFGRERDGVFCQLTEEAWRASRFNRRRRAELKEAA